MKRGLGEIAHRGSLQRDSLGPQLLQKPEPCLQHTFLMSEVPLCLQRTFLMSEVPLCLQRTECEDRILDGPAPEDKGPYTLTPNTVDPRGPGPSRIRSSHPAKLEKLQRVEGLLPESQVQNLTLTVLYVPYSLDSS